VDFRAEFFNAANHFSSFFIGDTLLNSTFGQTSGATDLRPLAKLRGCICQAVGMSWSIAPRFTSTWTCQTAMTSTGTAAAM
jgi:hypothetical protein